MKIFFKKLKKKKRVTFVLKKGYTFTYNYNFKIFFIFLRCIGQKHDARGLGHEGEKKISPRDLLNFELSP